ncbi:MAG: hypothetical protein F6K31_34965 [Symploca sp. SIO2G7]|nr:hypothetical protein [Symploca sp. SIO2G7]
MLSLQPIAFADLILSRLILDKQNEGLTNSALKDAVKTAVAHQLSGTALSEQIAQILIDLTEKGYVSPVGKARHRVTDDGKEHILAQLGLKALPARAQWKTLKDIDWINYALDLPTASGNRTFVGKAEGLRAAILHQYFQLPVDNFSTLTSVRNALLWQRLCDPAVAERLQPGQLTAKAFNQGTVMGVLLNDLLQPPSPLPWEKALKQLIAKIANAKRTDPNELRLAILRQAMAASLAPEPSPHRDTAGTPTALLLEDFAAAALNAAKLTQTGRFGDHRVFISHVWQTWQQRSEPSLSLDDFKQQLIEANRQRLLTLSRADLAHTLDADDVSASEITYLNSTFHFIRLD